MRRKTIRNYMKKGAAAFLTAAMLMTNLSAVAEDVDAPVTFAAEAETQAPETQAPETQAPETQAPETQAPETQAPETQAPETQAPETQAPETQAPETQAPETQAPETQAPETKAPETEAPSETSKETEAETEKKTEKETEEGVYIVEKEKYTLEVKLPKDLELPKNAELKVKGLKKEDERYKDALKLAEEENGEGTIGSYRVYDLHFEADGSEVKLEKREKEDIEVKLTFKKPIFDGKDFVKQELKTFHIKKLTEEELTQARAEAENTEGEEKEEISEYKAVELKTKATYTENKDGVEEISFKTDGFSDYLFGVTKDAEPESEKTSEVTSEPESETTAESESESTSEPESEAVSEPESETAAESETAVETEDAAMDALMDPLYDMYRSQSTLMMTLQSVGAVPANAESYHLTVKGVLNDNYNEIDVSADDSDIKSRCTYDAATQTLTIPVTTATATVVITGLDYQTPADVTGTPINYTVSAGGNTLTDAGTIEGTAAYSSVYVKDTVTNAVETEAAVRSNSPVTLQMSADRTLTVTNVYSTLDVTVPDSLSMNAKLNITKSSKKTSIPLVIEGGKGSIAGLPVLLGTGDKYSVELDGNELPKTYVGQLKISEKDVAISLDAPQGAAEFTAADGITKIGVKFTALDEKGEQMSENVRFTIEGNGKKYTAENGETLTGVLERGVKYKITQERIKGHIQPAAIKDHTLANVSSQEITMTNKATKVSISVNDPYGKAISNVKLEIRDEDGNVVQSVTTDGSTSVFTGVFDPGVKYTVSEVGIPAGYIGVKDLTFKVSATKGTANIQITNDTVKVSISRKGYDSRNLESKNKDGYDKNGYKNMKMLSGAKLEVQDMNGNVIDSWTSSADAPHMIEAKLAPGTTYRLVETQAPKGYEEGKTATFEAKNGRKVALATKRADGTIQIAKRVSYKGNAVKVSQTYYCALFTDADRTQVYAAGGVRPLQMTADTVYAVTTFTNVPAGTYYVAETDANGNIVNSNSDFNVSISNEQLNLTGGAVISEILNDYKDKPTGGFTYVSKKELKESYQQQYAGFGGSPEAAAALAAGDPVQTGDNTNIVMYVALLGAAVVILLLVFLFRRKRKKK